MKLIDKKTTRELTEDQLDQIAGGGDPVVVSPPAPIDGLPSSCGTSGTSFGAGIPRPIER